MRTIEPVNHDETKALLLLVMKGYKRKDVQFRESLDGTRHLRVGKDLDYVETHSNIKLDEISIFDDDCGRKYWYSIL